jgi:Peptidase A4 family
MAVTLWPPEISKGSSRRPIAPVAPARNIRIRLSITSQITRAARAGRVAAEILRGAYRRRQRRLRSAARCQNRQRVTSRQLSGGCAAPATKGASFWVGLDGIGTPTIEQTGTEADCSDGTAAYGGWFEIFPAAPVFYDKPVRPGDAMSAAVAADGSGAFTLTLAETTEQWTETTNRIVNGARQASAEIIAEAPGSQSVLPLADFGTVHFTGAAVNGRPAGDDNPIALTLVSGNGTAEASPSVLSGAASFTVTWASSGTGASSGTRATGTSGSGSGTTATTGSGHRPHHGNQDQG